MWRKNRVVIRTWRADGPVGRILTVKGVGGRKRINLIVSLRNLSDIFEQSGIGSFRARRNQESEKLDQLKYEQLFFNVTGNKYFFFL